jgi:hypothetical protein
MKKSHIIIVFICFIIFGGFAFFLGAKTAMHNPKILSRSIYGVAPESIYLNTFIENRFQIDDMLLFDMFMRGQIFGIGFLTSDDMVENIENPNLQKFFKEHQVYVTELQAKASLMRKENPDLNINCNRGYKRESNPDCIPKVQ